MDRHVIERVGLHAEFELCRVVEVDRLGSLKWYEDGFVSSSIRFSCLSSVTYGTLPYSYEELQR